MHSLLYNWFNFSRFSFICQNLNQTLAFESFVIVICYVNSIISSFLVIDMHKKLLVQMPDPVVRGLVSSIVIHRGPRTNRPNIVHLPIKTSHIERLIQSQTANRKLQSIGLHYLRKISKSRYISRRAWVVERITREILVTKRMPLMESHYLTIDKSILDSCESLNRGNLWHRLHTILRIKSSDKLLVFLYRKTTTPDSPRMDVSRSYRFCCPRRLWRWCLPVVNRRMLLF